MKSHLASLLAVLGLAFVAGSCSSAAPDGPPTLGQSLAKDWNSAMGDAKAIVMPSELTQRASGNEGWWQSTLDIFDANPGQNFGDDTERERRWVSPWDTKRSASYGLNKWALNYDPENPSRN